MNTWQTMPLQIPLSGVKCWVRLNYWFGNPFLATYSSTSQQWTSVSNGVIYPAWSISRWLYESEFVYATLTASGTGVGVSTLRIQVSSDQTLFLTGSARFYTNSLGTLGESSFWLITAGALRTIYLKCTTGTSSLIFTGLKDIIKFGSSSSQGWVSSTNAPILSISFDFPFLTQLFVVGACNISKQLPPLLTYLNLSGASILWTNSSALPAGLTSLTFTGDNILWTYSGALPSGLTFLNLAASNIRWTYSGALPSLINNLTLSGNYISWSSSESLPTALTYLYIAGTLINWTALNVGDTGNIGTFSLSNYRFSKMTSADLVTLLTQLTNRAGTLPSSITINDYADYASPPASVTSAVTLLKSTKSITTVILGA